MLTVTRNNFLRFARSRSCFSYRTALLTMSPEIAFKIFAIVFFNFAHQFFPAIFCVQESINLAPQIRPLATDRGKQLHGSDSAEDHATGSSSPLSYSSSLPMMAKSISPGRQSCRARSLGISTAISGRGSSRSSWRRATSSLHGLMAKIADGPTRREWAGMAGRLTLVPFGSSIVQRLSGCCPYSGRSSSYSRASRPGESTRNMQAFPKYSVVTKPTALPWPNSSTTAQPSNLLTGVSAMLDLHSFQEHSGDFTLGLLFCRPTSKDRQHQL